MVLLRRVIGDALRARRQGQHRTLREVSTAANVSLGYLSEIERGQKEASSELLAAICDALGARLSELLSEVSDTLSLAEDMDGVLLPVDDNNKKTVTSEGNVSVKVRQESPLKATLHATRKPQRDVVYAA
ncbi:helix-turn-helix transcriptional regulator [Actinoplanes sp. LDG1-06]|uniref:Helix-turn-helix transcriptional regulator n=1 Tax=Paractinoplanes ovalisporus TaxID=2810368 RepID=A0ABS2ACZ8_9ACTN|nr:helix-turn-helix transcriptional regulator [Actinoplanes ovalisporus]MBM2617701.1 helix-turn-helix transcriptional regulator [Actinoplanes ovalisporus]